MSNIEDIELLKFIGRHRKRITLGLLVLIMLGFVASKDMPYKDIDGDGLLNDEERALGTDPFNKDTDFDQLSDYLEVRIYLTDPLKKDSDGDYVSDYKEIKNGTNPLVKDLTIDSDGDYVSDDLETNTYGTDPLKIDSDSGGLDDYNEIYTYDMDPNDPRDDIEFMEKIPNVKVRKWEWDDGGVVTSENDYTDIFDKVIIISMRDPLLKWYAEYTDIRWEIDSEGRRIGKIYTNGEPIYGGPSEKWLPSPLNPSYYFTHAERREGCIISSAVNHIILKLMGYKCLHLFGEAPGWAHNWNEAYIDGNIYVVDYNDVIPRDNFYEKNGWKITSQDYDPEWYKKP